MSFCVSPPPPYRSHLAVVWRYARLPRFFIRIFIGFLVSDAAAHTRCKRGPPPRSFQTSLIRHIFCSSSSLLLLDTSLQRTTRECNSHLPFWPVTRSPRGVQPHLRLSHHSDAGLDKSDRACPSIFNEGKGRVSNGTTSNIQHSSSTSVVRCCSSLRPIRLLWSPANSET